jgi:putative ABC transport system ATP-binding protein
MQVRRAQRLERGRFRADHVGFIFQMFNLIPYLFVGGRERERAL